jgi:3D (Asp-Asp-Asp) domain-containing protein
MTWQSNRKAAWIALAAALCVSACASRRAPAPPTTAQPQLLDFEATAYSLEGKTASGGQAKEGICAADPDVLPIGSRIRVLEAGSYSGECVVTDTGRTITGREIDIYIASDAEAKRFGRKKVKVEILRP